MSDGRENLRTDQQQFALPNPMSRRSLLQSTAALLGTTAASGLVTAVAQAAPTQGDALTHACRQIHDCRLRRGRDCGNRHRKGPRLHQERNLHLQRYSLR